ncbi:MAG: hypothetical protein M3381_05560 [Actinomycetota bacterium]|nr:hypothetical protein [Actinomycetota bacterium]
MLISRTVATGELGSTEDSPRTAAHADATAASLLNPPDKRQHSDQGQQADRGDREGERHAAAQPAELAHQHGPDPVQHYAGSQEQQGT